MKQPAKVGDLKPAPYNPRVISPEQLSMLGKAMKEYGDLSGIVKNIHTNHLIGGHQRIKHFDPDWEITKTAKKDKTGTVAVGIISTPFGDWTYREVDWPIEKEKAANIAANQQGGDWNLPLLKDQILELDTGALDMDLLGFGEEELENLMVGISPEEPVDAEPQIDRAAELNKKWKVKIGDLFIIGQHKLLCGDCTVKENVEKLMAGEKADIVFTDPPYGINIVKGITSTNGGGKIFGRVRQPGGKPAGVVRGKGIVKPRLYHPVIGDDKSFNPTFLLNLAPKIILFGANHYASRLPDSPGWLVWDKGISPDATFSACELIWTNLGNHIKQYEYRWSGMIRSGCRKDELKDRIHPTQKPVGLCVRILSDYKAEIILDLFGGSGSTLIACQNLNRKCRMMEIDEGYCSVILQRAADAFPEIIIKRLTGESKRGGIAV